MLAAPPVTRSPCHSLPLSLAPLVARFPCPSLTFYHVLPPAATCCHLLPPAAASSHLVEFLTSFRLAPCDGSPRAQVYLVQLLDRWLRLASSFSDGDGADGAGGDGANEGSGSGHDRSVYKAGRAGSTQAGDDPRGAARALAMLESRALLPIPGGAMDATALRQLSQSAAATVASADQISQRVVSVLEARGGLHVSARLTTHGPSKQASIYGTGLHIRPTSAAAASIVVPYSSIRRHRHSHQNSQSGRLPNLAHTNLAHPNLAGAARAAAARPRGTARSLDSRAGGVRPRGARRHPDGGG